ncbi:MAG: hypothetical protein M3383_01970 [Actinomycetota bacterium]|nr:hypothetical protein [Actinomycetota bacterium]
MTSDRGAPSHAGLSRFALRAWLIAGVLASVLILTGVFPDLVGYVCLGVIVAATLLTSTERRREGGGWWTILGVGAIVSVAGAASAPLTDTIGGILAVIGGALVVIGATVGFPADEGAP